MAKILVADDNSNVQKTVVLALADLGVEIFSVNNGEAAVRKLSDFSPDLILADIFMPVRNGYEVCEFVKKDPRFSRVPVVLLVGAFDPFDEREAQRVGADGILKKPFVPPDPLITMVKTLLDRGMNERLVAVSTSKATVTIQSKGGGTAIPDVHVPAPEAPEESSTQEFPSPVEHVAFGEGEQPVAFGNFFETPAQDNASTKTGVLEPVDDEQILTSSRPASLGDPIFWRNDSPETEREAEEPEDKSSIPETFKETPGEDPPFRREESALLQPVEPLELVREEQSEELTTVVDSQPVLLDAAAQAVMNVEPDKAPDLAANPLEWMATAPTEQTGEASEEIAGWDEPIPEVAEAIDEVAPQDIPLELPPLSQEASEQVSSPVSVPVLDQTDAPTAVSASVASDVIPAAVAIPVPVHPASLSSESEVERSPTSQSATDTARSIRMQDWADLTRELESSPSQLNTHEDKPAQPALTATTSSQPAPTTPPKNSSPDPALVEAVVQRVLEKMRPQVVDIITKEFLRPIVQALVHREIEKQ